MSTRYKVLVAEDEVKIREILVDFLTDYYEVIEAKDGEEALRLFHSQQIDLVLLDLMMPGRDGFSVLKEIRSVSKVPVMILTARSSVEDQVKGYDLKVDDYEEGKEESNRNLDEQLDDIFDEEPPEEAEGETS